VVKHIESWLPTVADASAPILHAACGEGVQGGDYYGPGGLFEIAGSPNKARVNTQALDEQVAARLWSTAETLTGVRYLSERS